ncbi:oligosaccharyl transferase subunit ost3/OST6 [Nowakowskiella sp. JEL0407]|nr:oligosaccharyl transferase subunit ost3/OST6 [Nowakowskiella sp. JEL0407]
MRKQFSVSFFLLLAALSLLVAADAALDSRIKKLESAVAKSGGPSKKTIFDSELFSLVYDKPRNFSTVMIFTALDPRHKCKPCSDFVKQLTLVTSAWSRIRKPGQLYIAELDYTEKSAKAFQTLQLSNVPFVALFPATEGPLAKADKKQGSLRGYVPYDLNAKGLEADEFAKFIETETGLPIKVVRPVNWALYGILAVMTILLVVFIRVFGELIWEAVSNKSVWMSISIGSTIYFCAGHMWNSIRGPEFAGLNQGRVELFQGGFQTQYGVEPQLIAILYALTAIAFVVLSSNVPKIQNPDQQRVVFWLALVGYLVLYSVLMRIFKVKNAAYPYKLV